MAVRRIFYTWILLVLLLSACMPVATSSVLPTAQPPTAAAATMEPTNPPVPTPTHTPAGEDIHSLPWWQTAVFYEVFVRSFADSNGDGVGDFNGLTSKLDYLNELGVNALWLMPIHPSPSYHGYDVTDYRAVNPQYGTLDDFKRFLEEAHRRNMHVILDFVINHTSIENPWFQASMKKDSQYRDWYVWSQDLPEVIGPSGQTVWHRSPTGSGYYYGYFWSGMPDLNFRTPAVTQEIEDIARFWLLDMGVDGFRVDGARHLIEDGKKLVNTPETITWFKNFRAFYQGLKPSAMTVGEVWDNSYAAVRYPKEGALDMVFDFDLASALVQAVNERSARIVSDTLKMELSIFKPGQMATFLTNHDMDRVMSDFSSDQGKARLAASLLLTLPGTPFIYYGEEIGMLGKKPDEDIRRPMQWSAETWAGFTTGTPWRALNPDFIQKNVAVESADPDSLLSLYRKLIQLRTSSPALSAGDTLVIDSNHGQVFAMLRSAGVQSVLVLVNLSDKPVSDYRLSLAASALRGSLAEQTLLGGGAVAAPQVDEQGGFKDYQPLPELPAASTYLFQLTASH